MARFLWNGEEREITPQQGEIFDYEELRALFAGPLEAIPLAHNEVMLVDADGKRKQLPSNELATPLVQHFLRPGEMIAGPALVATRPELADGKALRKPRRDQVAANIHPTDHSAPYEPDERERQDIVELQRQLEPIVKRIAALEAKQRDPHLEELGEYFHLGRVGGSGKGTRRLNQRREAALDTSIKTARLLEPLYRQRSDLLRKIKDITSGKQQQRRTAKARQAEKRAVALARIQAVQRDEYVIDNLYGIVQVVKVNKKTVMIETSSGYRERRSFHNIRDVYHPQCWE